ncbi:MAG: zinc-ribbon domain-containing protein [Candidatus Bathyarchaeia archaeon]
MFIILSAAILIPVPAYTQSITCPHCNSHVTPNSNYCNFCGAALKPQPLILKICSSCRNRISSAAHFCPECGQKQE